MIVFFGLIALLVLSIIVIVHEFGHFIVAKKSGVWVEEFGLGLPPRIWGKKIGDTLYSFNALPIGGFVRLHGESLLEGEKVAHPDRSFVHKSKRVRIAVALAGIFMNFLLALVCFSIVYSILGIEREIEPITISEVASGSPAEKAGIKTGDIIYSVAGRDVTSTRQVQRTIAWNSLLQSRGRDIEFIIDRPNENGSERIITKLTPRLQPPKGEGAIGIAFGPTDVSVYYPPLIQRPFVAAFHGAKSTIDLSQDIVLGFVQISQDVSEGEAPKGVVGPVGILATISEFTSKYGLLALINLMGIISLNLAIFNLIPFPPLDGSRVMFVALESIVGKKRLPKIESITQNVGMAMLLLLFVVLTAGEIPKLIQAGSLAKFVEGLVQQ